MPVSSVVVSKSEVEDRPGEDRGGVWNAAADHLPGAG